jgi:hypothetical protein
MSTYAELIANAERRLRAYGGLTWDSTEIGAEINAGYQEFCRITHILRDTATVTVAANDALYAMPTVTGVAKILRIWRAEWDGRVLEVVKTYDMDRASGGSWRTATGSTLMYVMTDAEDPAQIRVHPMIESASYIGSLVLNIDYSYLPSAMTSGSPAIPEQYHPALEWWAVAQLQELPVKANQRPAMGDRASMHWNRYVGSAKAEVMEGLMHNYDTHVFPPAI